MGLALSQTTPTGIKLTKGKDYFVISDFTKNGFNFTEGCGEVSSEMCSLISKRINGNKPNIGKFGEKEHFNAFQIRLGGIKGVIVENNKLKKNQIQIRKSMEKFNSLFNELEIVNYSKFHPCFFNRQVLLLIENLGVKESVILDILDENLYEIDKSIQSIPRFGQFLHKFGNSSILRNISKLMINQLDEEYEPTKSQNFFGKEESKWEKFVNNEVFFAKLKTNYLIWILEEINVKQRIPNPEGAVLMGVYDFTGTLKEGEVFIQIKKDKFSPIELMKGKVLVCKNPAHQSYGRSSNFKSSRYSTTKLSYQCHSFFSSRKCSTLFQIIRFRL